MMGTHIDRSNRFLVREPVVFEQEFPTLNDILIESKQIGNGSLHDAMTQDARKLSNPVSLRRTGGLVRCGNPFCNRGGFELDFDLHEMVRNKLVSKEFSRTCPGDEGSPKGRKSGRKCLNTLRCRITIHYKDGCAPARVSLKEKLSLVLFPKCPCCDRPLVEEKNAELLFTCGRHTMRRTTPTAYQVVRSSGAQWWPKVGETVPASSEIVRVECLRVTPEVAQQLTEGEFGIPEVRSDVMACLRDYVPVIVESKDSMHQLRAEANRILAAPLTGADLLRSF